MIRPENVKQALEEANRNYITSAQLSKNHEGSNREWGKALRKAEDEGWVKQWSNNTPITWQITL